MGPLKYENDRQTPMWMWKHNRP